MRSRHSMGSEQACPGKFSLIDKFMLVQGASNLSYLQYAPTLIADA